MEVNRQAGVKGSSRYPVVREGYLMARLDSAGAKTTILTLGQDIRSVNRYGKEKIALKQ